MCNEVIPKLYQFQKSNFDSYKKSQEGIRKYVFSAGIT